MQPHASLHVHCYQRVSEQLKNSPY